MSSPKIVGGVMVSFDIFEKKDIQRLEEKINRLFSVQSKNEKLSIRFFGSHDSIEVNQTVWQINISDLISSLSEKKITGIPIKNELIEPYVNFVEMKK
jgi:hypothetical protein